MIDKACEMFGYKEDQVELRFYAGKFTSDKDKIIKHLKTITTGAGPVKVYDLDMILHQVLTVTESKTYMNDPVVMTLKALKQSGRL